jgi:hypothetical protein
MSKEKYFHPSVFVFTVEGATQFPIDMLRWDLCYPKTEEDSFMIALNARHYSKDTFYRVTLVSMKRPDIHQWRALGWEVEIQ